MSGVVGRIPVFLVNDRGRSHLPLSLGMLQAAAERHRGGDLDRLCRFEPTLGLEAPDLLQLALRSEPGIWLFSSYVWSVQQNLEISRFVKTLNPANLTIHGGPSTPKYPEACREFLAQHPHVDVAARGEGENTVVELLERVAAGWGDGPRRLEDLEVVAGITFLAAAGEPDSLRRTAERPRETDLDRFPSPYLEGVFDGDTRELASAVIETNRGCPYGCTFCDWGSATLQKVRCFDLARVEAEIDWVARRGVPVLWLADANFGILPRDVEIAERIAAVRERFGFPHEVVVNYAKNGGQRLAEIVRILQRSGVCTQGIISIQTTDPATLDAVRRSNIKTSRYGELSDTFRREGLPLATDLMIGLPGATVESFKLDLQTYFDQDIQIKAYRTELLVNSPMAEPEYRRRWAIETDEDGFLVSTASYSRQDLARMLNLNDLFNLFESRALLRYVLRHLQWDHGVQAIGYLERVTDHLAAGGERLPVTARLVEAFEAGREMPWAWPEFFAEHRRWIRDELGIEAGQALDVALRVNESVMPDPAREVPLVLSLRHDFAAYFADGRKSAGKGAAALSSYPPGVLRITDPFGMCQRRPPAEQYDTHQSFWELSSPLARPRSEAYFPSDDEALAAPRKEAAASPPR